VTDLHRRPGEQERAGKLAPEIRQRHGELVVKVGAFAGGRVS
jgi:hypothetical protein